MPQQYNFNGNILTIPGTYVESTVINNQSGIGLLGVVSLVGEANSGPAWTEEEDITSTAFRPDQINAVIQKYGSGNLVDGFRAAISGNADARITGAPNLIHLVKTNRGEKALSEVIRQGFGTWGELTAKRAGRDSNQISYRAQTLRAEVAPGVENVAAFLHPTDASSISIRVHGGTEVPATLPAIDVGHAGSFAGDIDPVWGPLGVVSTGGEMRNVLPGGAPTLSVSNSSGNLVVALSSGSWANLPSLGDVLMIAHNSTIEGASGENVGTYRVLSANSTTITAQPVNFVGPIDPLTGAAQNANTPIRAFECYSPMNFSDGTGMDRQVLDGVSGNITSSDFTARTVKLSLDASVKFAATAQVGEIVWVPAAFAGVLFGFYRVQSVSNDVTGQMTLERLSNGDLVSAPASVAVSSSLLSVRKKDIDGIGKTVEILADALAESIVRSSTTGLPHPALNRQLNSPQERTVRLDVQKVNSPTNITESYQVGGDVVFSMGYAGASCDVSIDNEKLTTVCSDPADDLELLFADFATLNALAGYLNSTSRFKATVVNPQFGGVSPVELCNLESKGAASTLGLQPLRVKRDAQDAINKLAGSGLVALSEIPMAGLPDHSDQWSFLAGGSKGASTGAQISDAIDAMQLMHCNLVVPLFSQDAAQDVAEGLTEDPANPADRYEIDAINAKVKSHCIEMSQVKARKNRLAVVSKWTQSYEEAKDAARQLMHPRVALAFAKAKDVSSTGQIRTFPAWYLAAKCAGQTAAAGYKGIVKKFSNITGVVYPQGFDPRINGDLEDALTAGLLILEKVNTGGFRWVSDQTTYSADNNFVYNSIQAVYVSDLLTLQLIANSDNVIVGQSVADMSAGIVKGFIQSEMATFLRLKYIAPSDDAPLGYKDLTVQISGPVVNISASVKLAGILYFVPIQLAIEQVEQSA